MVTIKEMLAPAGSKCRPGYALKPTYITIHNTANTNSGAGAENHGKYLQGGGKSNTVSWHYAVDDKLIVLCIPENEAAWHAGDGGKGTGNRNSLAIEICENPESDLETATNNAAELTASLMEKYSIPLDRVVQHNHWSDKDCPRRIRRGEPYNWDTFLSRVQGYLNGETPSASMPGAEPTETIDVEYQTYTGKSWLEWVENYNTVNSDGYAGVTGKAATAIRVGLSKGHIQYRAHTKGGKWWSWITDYNTKNTNGYAGVLGKEMDMLQMTLVDLPGYTVEYRVSTVGGDYLPWVRDYNTTDSDGYAGITGKPIDRVQIRIVKV